MRVGIDARFLTHPQVGGFKTYTENLVRALADCDRVNEYVLYVDRQPADGTGIPRQSNVSIRVMPGWVPVVGMAWREQVSLARQAWHDRLDVLHCPVGTAPLRVRCPLVLTLHDTFWMDPPQPRAGLFGRLRRPIDWYYRLIPARAAKQALAVITVSQFSKQDICQRLGLDPTDVIVTPEAAGPQFAAVPDPRVMAEVLRRRTLSPGFVLGLAAPDRRKNAQSLVEAFALLSPTQRSQRALVIVCSQPVLAADLGAQAERLGVGEQVRLLCGVQNEELLALFQGAAVFAFPSRSEGFGLPILEAMACGTPAVGYANSSIPEVAGDAAVLCDDQSPAGLSAALARVLGEPDLRTRLIDRGRLRAASFSWERCARQTVDCYGRVVARARARGQANASSGGLVPRQSAAPVPGSGPEAPLE